MPVGGGSALATAREMARARREMQRQQRARKAQRALHRAESALQALARIPVDERPEAHTWRVDHACFFVCLSCGYLEDSGDDVCLGCGKRTWADLADEAKADAVHTIERHARQTIPGWFKAGLLSALVGLCVLLAFLGHTAATEGWGLWKATLAIGADPWVVSLIVISTFLVPTLYMFTLRPLAVFWSSLWPSPPQRWKLPTPAPLDGAKPERVFTGRVRATDDHPELINAPFSGRPCLAYTIGVRFSGAGDAQAPSWALQESGGLPFMVGDERVGSDAVLLELPIERLHRRRRDLNLKRFLRKRGLFAADGSFTLYESIVVPGDALRIHAYPYAVSTAHPLSEDERLALGVSLAQDTHHEHATVSARATAQAQRVP